MRATRLAAVVAMAAATVGYAGPAYADDVREAQWHLGALRVAEAHRHSLGDGVTVAVLDSGVDASHPDLRDNVLPGIDLVDQGSDGRDDPGGTGTALAGLIAGHGHGALLPPERSESDDEDADADAGEDAGEDADEAEAENQTEEPAMAADGVLGLAPRAAILPVVVAAPGTSPEPATLAAGIDEAVRGGADVICIGRPIPDDLRVSRALGAAVAAGVVVVVPAAAGGDAFARYGGAGLLGAVPTGGELPRPGVVAVPAAGVMSAGGQGGYYRYARTGDAAASAVLAGAATLVRAAYPNLSSHDITYRIRQTSDGGALDLVAALTADVAAAPRPPTGPPRDGSPPPPEPAPTDPAGPPGSPGAAPGPGAGPEAGDWVAAFDSDDWRRWLVAAPLVVFLVALVAVSVAAARRARR